jgi:hypothetical protein
MTTKIKKTKAPSSDRKRSIRFSRNKVLILTIALVFAIVCYWIIARWGLKYNPERVIAVRKDLTGQIVQQVTYATAITESILLPGPHGPQRIKEIKDVRYYLLDGNTRKTEMTFLRNRHLYGNEWHAVDDTDLWIVTKLGVQGISGSRWAQRVTVLDQKHVLHERTLSSFEKNDSEGIEYFRLMNGNRTIIYKSRQGMKAYDVKTDTELDWK